MCAWYIGLIYFLRVVAFFKGRSANTRCIKSLTFDVDGIAVFWGDKPNLYIKPDKKITFRGSCVVHFLCVRDVRKVGNSILEDKPAANPY